MNWVEAWLDRIYRPVPKPWKRKALFWLSLAILLVALTGGYAQHVHSFAGADIW